MTSDLLLLLATAGMAGVLLVAVLYREIYRVGGRTAEQVLPLLSPLCAMGVHELFSPVAESYLRMNLTSQQFRRAQRHRIVLALEYTHRISNNAVVLQQWATHELGRARHAGTPDCSRLSMELVAATVRCRLCSLVLRTRLYLCRCRLALLPFTAPPSFADLTRLGKVDLLAFYSTMRSAADKLGRYYGKGHQSKLAELL